VTRPRRIPSLSDLQRRSDAVELPEALCPPGLQAADVLVSEPLREAAFMLGCAPDARDRDGLVARARELLAARAREVYALRLDCDLAAARGLVACESGLQEVEPGRRAGRLQDLDRARDWVLLRPANVVARCRGRWRGIELAEEVERYVSDSVADTWRAAARGDLDEAHAPEVRPDPRPPGPVAALLEAWGWALTSPAAWAACPMGARIVLVGLSAPGAVLTIALTAADHLGRRDLSLPATRDVLVRDRLYDLVAGVDVGGRGWAAAASEADAGLWPRDAGPGRRGFAPCSLTPEQRAAREAARARREAEWLSWCGGVP
jgi:hypothetical protein